MKTIAKFLTKVPVLVAASLVAAYFLFCWFAVDPLARRLLPWVGETQLASRLSVEKLNFDPLTLELTVDGLRLERPDGGKLAGWERLYVDLQADSLFRFAWHLRDIRLSRPYGHLAIGKDGRLNWADLLAKLNENSQPSDTMPRVVIDHLQIDGGTLQYAEQNRPDPFHTELAPLSVALDGFSTLPEDRGDYQIAAGLTELGGSLRWKGNFGVNPLASAGAVELRGLKLASLSRLLHDPAAPMRIDRGELGLQFAYDFAMVRERADVYPHIRVTQVAVGLADVAVQLNPQTALTLKSAGTTLPAVEARLDRRLQVEVLPFDLSAAGLSLAHDDRQVLGLQRIDLREVMLDPDRRMAGARALELAGLQTDVILNADGSLNWTRVLQSATSKPAAPPSPAAGDASKAPAWTTSLDRLQATRINVHIEDRSGPQSVPLDISDAQLALDGELLNLSKPVSLKATLPLRQGGQLDVTGSLAAQPLKGDLKLSLAGLQLKSYAPYLSRYAALKLAGGTAAVRGKLSLNAAKGFSARFNGGFSIDRLVINEEASGEHFLSWDSVGSDSLKLSLAPNRLQMNELRIVHPKTQLIIHEDKTLNAQHLLREQPASGKPTPAKAKGGAQDAFPVSVDRISIRDGDLDFADLSLRPQFGTHVHDLEGVINGLSTNPAGAAQVELDGKVDDYGSARLRGSVQPFRATEFTDLKATFRNLEMNRLTPYSGKFAGRKIDSGKLSVDLEYKIKNRQLSGENKFVINTLKLGERVDSRDAMNLPLDLAVALLEDSNGVIDLDLPISGSLDDPQFSYGRIVWKAIVNVLQKVVTAPFRALGKLLGLSSEQLEAIVFDPGSDELAPPEREKIASIAAALAKRPSLVLNLIPSADVARDTAALQEQATRRDVLIELGIRLRPGEHPGPLDLSNVKAQTAIDNLLKDRSGQKRGLKMIDSAKDYFRKSRPEDLPVYAEKLAQLQSTVKVSDDELSGLATARANAIRARLLEAGLDPARIKLAPVAKVSGDGKSVPVKMELGAR